MCPTRRRRCCDGYKTQGEARQADPIFAAIEGHRGAEGAFSKAVSRNDEDSPGVDSAERVASHAMRKLRRTKPKTMAGFAAFITYLRPLYENDDLAGRQYYDGRTSRLFETLEVAAKKLAAERSP